MLGFCNLYSNLNQLQKKIAKSEHPYKPLLFCHVFRHRSRIGLFIRSFLILFEKLPSLHQVKIGAKTVHDSNKVNIYQDTIEYVSWPIQNSLLFFKIKKCFFYLHFMQPFSADATIFKKEIFVHENIKKTLSKWLIIGPKPAQISIYVP